MVVVREAVEFAHVLGFADPQHDALDEPVEAAKGLLRTCFLEVPRANGMLDRLQHGVLSNAWDAAEHQPMVDLFLRALHAMGEPFDDVVGFVGVNLPDVFDPRLGFGGIARRGPRRPVEVEYCHARPFYPTAVTDESVADELGQSRGPGHLLNRRVLRQPRARFDCLFPAWRRDWRNSRVDARRWPEVACRKVDVIV